MSCSEDSEPSSEPTLRMSVTRKFDEEAPPTTEHSYDVVDMC